MLIGRCRACSPSTCRPRLGLRPTRPAAAAGIRIEPPPSFACAMGTTPEATSAADPPLEAPTEYPVCHGLWTGSSVRYSVVALKPNSGNRDLPTIVRPVARYCAE